jgi:hypothetical protein
MSTLIKVTEYVPVNIGDFTQGGYFAGYISHTANGNPTHSLIVAPRASGQASSLLWASNSNASDGVNYSTTLVGGSFTGSISGTTMTVTAVSSGKIRPGHTITGTAVALGTVVVSQISGTANGIGDYALSVSQTVTSRALTAGTSEFDGVANGTMFKDIDPNCGNGGTLFPAANFCEALTINGFSDWYLPSRFELDIAYFNLKPTTEANGMPANVYSVLRRPLASPPNFPLRTYVTAFTTTAESFIATYARSSTDGVSNTNWQVLFSNGTHLNTSSQNISVKNSVGLGNVVRAFRRVAL